MIVNLGRDIIRFYLNFHLNRKIFFFKNKIIGLLDIQVKSLYQQIWRSD